MVLRGYLIPKDTMLCVSSLIFKENFEDYEKFQPERWMDGKKKEICPYAVRPFGHGPRMCIGKRFAELELLIVVHKLVTNFQVNWVNEEPLTLSQAVVTMPDQKMNFQFMDIIKK